MLPSSFNKICCDGSTCPKRNCKRPDTTPITSSIEEMHDWVIIDKESEKTSPKSSSSSQTVIPKKTSEKSTEAYLNRNHENISVYAKKFCPSNSSETCPTEAQISDTIVKYNPSTTITEKSQSSYKPQPLPKTRHKCTCQRTEITPSSSCNSLTPEYVSVKLQLDSNIEYRTRHINTTSRPQLLQTNASKSFFTYQLREPWDVLQCFQQTSTFSNQKQKSDYSMINHMNETDPILEEQFYSCSSDDSENDEMDEKLFAPQETCTLDKNSIILQLLQEVVHLINMDESITELAPSGIDDSSTPAKESDIKVQFHDKLDQPTSTTQLNSFLWPLQPRFGYCPAHLPPYNVPYFPPFNFINSGLDGAQMPEPFMQEELQSFGNCFSCSESVLTADNLTCICSTKCGPLQYTIKSQCPSLAEIKDIKIDASTQSEYVGKKLSSSSNQYECEKAGSFKDCSSGKDSAITAEKLPPSDFSCKCLCQQYLLKDRDKDLALPVADSKTIAASSHSVAETCPQLESLDNKEERNVLESSLEMEEYIDEELHPPYVDKVFTEPFEAYNCTGDCLLEYDDEEPVREKLTAEEDVKIVEPQDSEMLQQCSDSLMESADEFSKIVECENLPALTELFECEGISTENENVEEFSKIFACENLPAIMELFECEELNTEEKVEEFDGSEKLIERAELVEEKGKLPKLAGADFDELSCEKVEKSTILTIEPEVEKPVEETDALPYLIEEETYSNASQNMYSILPETNNSEDSKKLIPYELSEYEDEYQKKENQSDGEVGLELNKVELAKRKKPDQMPGIEKGLGSLRQGSPAEMKFFIDSLLLDFEAMEYARRKSQFEKNIGKPKRMGLCARDSFPVTITNVTDLGANSLYIKWKIHDCSGITGYEIYTDGYLTNRYYNSRHNAAVITNVDITLPHKIALVAQSNTDDESFDAICNMNRNRNKLKSLPWKTTELGQRKSYSALWTPSIFLYDPTSDGIPVSSPVLQNNLYKNVVT